MAQPVDQLSDYARQKSKPEFEYGSDDLELEVDEDSEAYEEDEDGNIITDDEEGLDEPDSVEFDGNLASLLTREERTAIGQPYLELIEQDIGDREPHDKKYAEGIKRSGLGEEGPGGAPFDGASTVTHPILTECAIDFQSSAMKEILPPQGPVKTKIMGMMTPEKRQKSERKRDFMNWQITDQIEECYTEAENMLMQLPFSGAQYLHWFQDKTLGRPSVELITSDCVYLPYGSSSFYMADRMTVKMTYSEVEVQCKIDHGDWVDIENISSSLVPERTKTQVASDKVEGVTEGGFNEDGLKDFYRVFTWCEFDFDELTEGARAPYILIVDSETGDIANIRRNWEEEDSLLRKLDHVVEFKFFPWKGPYGIGFTHMIGGLSASMTGSLRALLDTAHINNFPALLKMKSKTGGQSLTLEATGVTEIEGTTPVDDIRKLIMPVPYNPPSTVLFQLLGWLDEKAKGVVTTAEEKIQDASNNGPVGTTLALIEQGSKVYANIHARLHRSIKKCLQILHRLNKDYLDDEITVEELGDLIVYRKDFEGPMDIIPVSDPHIFSESQRYAQLQAVRQLRTQEPDLFNRKALVRRELQQLRVDNPEELLVPDPQMVKANPVAENIMMAKGRPAAAFPEQDHLAHIKVIMEFMKNPNLGASPIIAPKYLPLALQHMAEHIILWYGTYIHEAMTSVIGPEFERYLKLDPLSQKIDKALALIVEEIHTKMDHTLAGTPEIIQQAIQLMQQYQQPQDPLVMEVRRKEKRDVVEEKLKTNKLQLEDKKSQMRHETDMARTKVSEKEIELEGEAVDKKSATDIITNRLDNQTKFDIADMKDDEKDEDVKHYKEGGLVRAHEDEMPGWPAFVAAMRDRAPNVDMSPVIQAINDVNKRSTVNIDLSTMIEAIKDRSSVDFTPVIEAINAKPVTQVDLTPVIEAIKALPAPPSIDLTPVVEAINAKPTGMDSASVLNAIRSKSLVDNMKIDKISQAPIINVPPLDLSPLSEALDRHSRDIDDRLNNAIDSMNDKHNRTMEELRKRPKKRVKIEIGKDSNNKTVGHMYEEDEEGDD